MKGLILKDLYCTWVRLRFIMIVCVAIAVGSFFIDNHFYLTYPCIFVSAAAVSLISYDEREKWDVFSLTMPCNKKMYVTEKYILSVIFSVAISIMTVTVQGFKMSAAGSFDILDLLMRFIYLICVSLLPLSVMVPPVLKFGAEKGRLVYFIMIGIFTGFSTTLSVGDVSIKYDLIWIISGATAVMFTLSLLISIALYKNKDLK